MKNVNAIAGVGSDRNAFEVLEVLDRLLRNHVQPSSIAACPVREDSEVGYEVSELGVLGEHRDIAREVAAVPYAVEVANDVIQAAGKPRAACQRASLQGPQP